MKTKLFKLYQLCVNGLSFSLCRSSSLSLLFGSFKAKLNRLRDVPVNLGCLVGQLARTIDTNYRIFLGGLMLLVVAPLSGVAYQLFDINADYPGWYYGNYYYLFLVLCPQISMGIMLTGIFFLFPLSKRTWFISMPLAYPVSRILWIISAESNDQFNQITPGYFLLIGLVFSIIWLLSFNFLVNRKYHKFDGICARLEGVLKSPGLDSQTKIELATPLIEEIRHFN